MASERPVIVIGAAGIDIKARPLAGWQMRVSNLGTVRNGTTHGNDGQFQDLTGAGY